MDRQPPYNIDAEQSVLGAILLNNEAAYTVTAYLTNEMFYSDTHKIIFKAMSDMLIEKLTIDLVTISNRLRHDDLIDRIGGSVYLLKLVNSVPSTATIDHYGKIVLKAYQARKLISISSNVMSECYSNGDPIETIANYQSGINQLIDLGVSRDFTSVKDLITPAMDAIEEINTTKIVPGIGTGFIDLDKSFRLRDEELTILAARPGMGKTSLSLNIAYNVAKSNKVVGFICMEMSKKLLFNRIFSAVSEVPLDSINTGIKEDHHWKMLTTAIGKLSETKLLIDDTAKINAAEIRAKAMKLKRNAGCDLLIIDYLGLIGGKNKDGRRELVSQNIRDIKAMTMEMQIPTMLLCQLNREVEGRQKNEPRLSDLRESGEVEQTADNVIFISGDPNSPESKIIIAKQRNGATGYVNMFYRKELTKFYNYKREQNTPDDWRKCYDK